MFFPKGWRMIQEAGTLFRKDRARRGRFDRLPLAPLRRNCGHIAEKLLPLATIAMFFWHFGRRACLACKWPPDARNNACRSGLIGPG
jgi:hypothetical protein